MLKNIFDFFKKWFCNIKALAGKLLTFIIFFNRTWENGNFTDKTFKESILLCSYLLFITIEITYYCLYYIFFGLYFIYIIFYCIYLFLYIIYNALLYYISQKNNFYNECIETLYYFIYTIIIFLLFYFLEEIFIAFHFVIYGIIISTFSSSVVYVYGMCGFFQFYIVLITFIFYFIPKYVPDFDIKSAALVVTLCVLIEFLIEFKFYDQTFPFQLNISEFFVGENLAEFSIFHFSYDAISLILCILTVFIFPIVILVSWDSITYKINLFYFNMLLLELLILGAFLAFDLFTFFVFFEGMFIPLVLIILIWGSRPKKLKAVSYLFLYTLFGSVFFLTGILYLYAVFGTTNYFYLLNNIHVLTSAQSGFLWICFFIPFAIKIPMFPFHSWLPEAHVEAPTAGSIVLAAVLLKVGAYGFIRFLIPLFKISSIENTKLVCVLAVIGMLYSSYVAIRQIDMKKMIAYSSISHMNFIVLGIFSFDYLSLYGALVLMLGHAVVSSALFFLSGVLYDRYHTRSIEYFGGAAHTMPIFSIFLFIFLIANMGFPCSPSFIGEFFIFLGVVSHFGPIVTILVSFTLVLNTCFNIRLFSKIVFGPVNGINGVIYQDLTKKELKILISFLSCSLALFFLHFYYMSFFTYNLSLYFNLYV